MRRSPLKYGVRVWIKKVHPFTWKTCQSCLDEVKRETVWKVKIRWEGLVTPLPNPQEIYFCIRCYRFKSDIVDMIRKQANFLMDNMVEGVWKVKPRVVIMK